jgi:hypothetical protein
MQDSFADMLSSTAVLCRFDPSQLVWLGSKSDSRDIVESETRGAGGGRDAGDGSPRFHAGRECRRALGRRPRRSVQPTAIPVSTNTAVPGSGTAVNLTTSS